MRMNFPADYCTMKNGKDVCKIEYTFSNGTKGFKFPKLMELYEHLFPGVPAPQNLHNSLADTVVTLKCYCKLAHDVNLSLESRHFRILFRETCSWIWGMRYEVWGMKYKSIFLISFCIPVAFHVAFCLPVTFHMAFRMAFCTMVVFFRTFIFIFDFFFSFTFISTHIPRATILW